jgi:hypothetical protein
VRLSPQPALSLAALRVVVPVMLLVAPGFSHGVQVAGWDPARFVVPEGLGWFVVIVPIDASWARGAQAIMLASAVLAALGAYARPALVVLTLSAFYLYSIAQLTGFVWHDMHLLWFSALLAASPCADVLAWDAEYPVDTEHERYALPLMTVWLLLSAVYFFPGLHKLLTSGVAWALSDNLRNQIYWKWLQHGVLPAFHPDQIPGLLPLGGLFVLLFELSFGVLVWIRRLRPWLAVAGVIFHLLAEWLFRIPFASLWLCYVTLVDLRPVARRLRRVLARILPRAAAQPAAEGEPPTGPPRRLTGVVGAVLVVGAFVQGARGQMAAYPFACYPTFEWRAGTTMPDLGLVAVGPGDAGTEIPHARDARGYRHQRQWAEVWSLAGVYGEPDKARLRAYLSAVAQAAAAQRALRGATGVRFYRDALSVLPEDRDKPPINRTLIYEVRLQPRE